MGFFNFLRYISLLARTVRNINVILFYVFFNMYSGIKKKYPDRVPVIVEKAPKSALPDIDKRKFLVPNDVTVGQFIGIIRGRIKLHPAQAIFVFINNELPSLATPIVQIYDKHKSDDEALYMTYTGENTFG
jgi:GABA(A) receptor-associated protein